MPLQRTSSRNTARKAKSSSGKPSYCSFRRKKEIFLFKAFPTKTIHRWKSIRKKWRSQLPTARLRQNNSHSLWCTPTFTHRRPFICFTLCLDLILQSFSKLHISKPYSRQRPRWDKLYPGPLLWLLSFSEFISIGWLKRLTRGRWFQGYNFIMFPWEGFARESYSRGWPGGIRMKMKKILWFMHGEVWIIL